MENFNPPTEHWTKDDQAAFIQIAQAYQDCHDNKPEAMVIRNLNFRSPHWFNKEQAQAVAEAVIIHGYNEFNHELLNYLPDDSKVQFAREGSVCLYVKSEDMRESSIAVRVSRNLRADEADYAFHDDEWRFWWD